MNPASLKATTATRTTTSSANRRNLSGTTGAFSVKNFFKMMKYERLRLITYLLYGHQWPKMEVISPTELAKAGFFYMNEDAVKCAFCRGVVSNWQHGDVAMEAHQRLFPNCAFIRGEYCGNMPFEIDPDINSTPSSSSNRTHCQAAMAADSAPPGKKLYSKSNLPDFPRLADPLSRSQTFLSPNWKSTAVSVEDLVDAGFFYTRCEDSVRCYHCGGVLKNWAPGEVPLEEHARFFPECHFLVSTRSQTYIEFVQFKSQIIELRRKLDTPPAVEEADIACMRAITYQNFLNMKQSASRVMNRLEKRNSQRRGTNGAGTGAAAAAGTSRPTAADSGQGSGSQSSGDSDQGEDRPEPSSPSGDLNTFLQKYLSKFSFLTDCQKLFQYLTSLEIMPPTTTPITTTTAASPTTPETPRMPVSESASTSSQATVQQANSNDSFNSSGSSSSEGSADWSPTSGGNVISISIFSLDDGSSESGFEEDDGGRQSSCSATTSDEEGDSHPCKQLTKNALQCIICCDRQIEIVFVPCGHQLACRKCCERMTTCPVCRLAIESKVRTYFANC